MEYSDFSKYAWLAVTVIWFIFMTYLSHQTGSKTARTSQKLAEFLGNEEMNGDLRRMAHVIVFLVLGVLVSETLSAWGTDRRWGMLVLVWCVVDESSKIPVEGRHFAWLDVGLNMIGTAAGGIIAALMGS